MGAPSIATSFWRGRFSAVIAHVVLHVADDHVLPVRDVHGAVFSKNDVGGTEVFVAAEEEPLGVLRGLGAVGVGFVHLEVFPGGFPPDGPGGGVSVEAVLFDAAEPDDVGDEEVALHFLGKLLA